MGALTETTTEPKVLLLDGFPAQTKALTIAEGESLVAGELVGTPRTGDAGTPVAGTNTGNGTITGTITKGKDVEAGTYKLTCITIATNGGMFAVVAPSGAVAGYAKVGTAFTSTHLSGFTIGDGSTDFALGDTYTIAVAAGDGKGVAYNPAASSHNFEGVLATDIDATDGDVIGTVYRSGNFVKQGLTGYSNSLEQTLRINNCFVKEQA